MLVDITASFRGSIVIELVSPKGTLSTLLHTRPRDSSPEGIQWLFLTVRNWDESPVGLWALHVYSALGSRGGRLQDWQLICYGTA